MITLICISFLIVFGATLVGFMYGSQQPAKDVSQQRKLRNKRNGVTFIELTRYDTESVILRTDSNVRILVPHIELEKHFEVI